MFGRGNASVNQPTDSEAGWEYYDESSTFSTFWQHLVYNNSMDPLDYLLKYVDNPKEEGDEELHPINDFLRIQVPLYLAPSIGHNSVDQKWNESAIQENLIHPLEAFICGTNDTEAVFKVYDL